MQKNNLTLIISFLLILFISCKEKNIDQLCSEKGFAKGIVIESLNYKPSKAKLYLYKENSIFNELVEVKDPIVIYDRDNITVFRSIDYARFFLNYDYRLVIDDTICFDLSEFNVKLDTVGRTIGGWTVICNLVSFKCNDSICTNKSADGISPPFEVRRIIKKGQYDE